MSWLAAIVHAAEQRGRALARDRGAVFDLSGRTQTLVAVIIGAVVIMVLIAALLPTFFDSVADVNENLSTATTGDATADALLPVFVIVVAVGAVLAIVGLILTAVRLRRM